MVGTDKSRDNNDQTSKHLPKGQRTNQLGTGSE